MNKLTKKVYCKKCIKTDCHRGNDDQISNVLPIVYSENYGVNFCGLEKLHPFDAAKGYHIMQILIAENFSSIANIHNVKQPVTKKELLKVHTRKYLRSLKWSINAAKISEIPLLAFVPNYFVQRSYLRPMRFQTAGSILAGKLALQDGWSINLGGGFHHCCSYQGGGFCAYADITLLIERVMEIEKSNVRNVMIIDLDAHQGNGHERDFMDNEHVFILDMYNAANYPGDNSAKLAIRCAVELKPRTSDDFYLRKLNQSLQKSFQEFLPNLIVYNAGTDILQNDPLGLLDITPEGVIKRDEIVFRTAITKQIPIVMLLSGGYLKSSAKVIADSIINLQNKGLLTIKS